MKRSFLIVLAVLIVTALCVLTPLAETVDGADTSSNVQTTSSEPPAWQVAIMYFIMFTGISVIGVMFIKVVKKNNRR